MTTPDRFVVFTLDELRAALPLAAVVRVVRAVEVTPLPKAPEVILGLVNVEGQVIPALNLRKRLRRPEREIDPSDQFIIAHGAQRTVALVADRVLGVLDGADQELIPVAQILPDLPDVEAVVKSDGELILICNLVRLLSLVEETTLDQALQAGNGWK